MGLHMNTKIFSEISETVEKQLWGKKILKPNNWSIIFDNVFFQTFQKEKVC